MQFFDHPGCRCISIWRKLAETATLVIVRQKGCSHAATLYHSYTVQPSGMVKHFTLILQQCLHCIVRQVLKGL